MLACAPGLSVGSDMFGPAGGGSGGPIGAAGGGAGGRFASDGNPEAFGGGGTGASGVPEIIGAADGAPMPASCAPG
jgi:hypothetical protein